MKNNIVKISIGMAALCLLISSCASPVRQVWQDQRPFQERKFDARLWRTGDAQTRGEMSRDLHWRQSAPEGFVLDNKNRAEVLEILGEPDRKTRGRCCGAGGTSDKEVWLYNLEIKNGAELRSEHFQIYFHDRGTIDELRIDAWDDENPDYFPRVG